MRRREFMALIGGAAIPVWPLAARGQQPGTLKRIVYINPAFANAVAQGNLNAGQATLVGQGWVPGRTLAIEPLWGNGDPERLRQLVAKAVADQVDLLFSVGSVAALAAKDATKTIPIVVISLEGDAVADGLVQSLARPGGNVTGVFLNAPEVSVKHLQLLKEIAPQIARVGVLSQPKISDKPLAALAALAGTYGVTITHLPFNGLKDIEPVSAAIATGQLQGLVALSSPLISGSSAAIAAMTLKARIPAISMFREFSQNGGLLHYGPLFADMFRQAALLTDRILRGAKPADLAVQQPTKFEMVLNMKTARALGLTIPPLVLAQADEVIE